MNGHDETRDYSFTVPLVYIFEAVGHAMAKIGQSSDPVKRFRQIQTACPYAIRAVALGHGGAALERELHHALSDRRLHGEWFDIDDDFLDYVASSWRHANWRVWHLFVRNVSRVRPCERREISFEEFEAICQYETEFNNPLDRSLL